MINIHKHLGVFVPFEEKTPRKFKRRRDLPIFTDPLEVADYIQKSAVTLGKSKLQWIQCNEPVYLAEYRDKIWLQPENKK